MQKVVLDKLFLLQSELDAQIALNHGISYETTKNKRVMALLVELGEFANETRCFKFWSFKGPSPKEVILDEYADGLHFLLSLGIILGYKHFEYSYEFKKKDLTEHLLDTYSLCSRLHKEFTKENYETALISYINILGILKYSAEDLESSYLKKLNVNHSRQENNY
ncbi:MAG: dUTP diphosphatase [Bacilli bacterium]|nr:dUTP diphosphatase [Bacilli bacterium]MDY6430556.1 dUTP diphosphatase [Bacilli bacterium]